MGEMRNAYKLVCSPEGKTLFGRPKHRWQDIITGCESVDWMHLAQNKDQWQVLVNTAMKPSGSIKDWYFLDQPSDYMSLRPV
jgi:hypothetical protein